MAGDWFEELYREHKNKAEQESQKLAAAKVTKRQQLEALQKQAHRELSQKIEQVREPLRQRLVASGTLQLLADLQRKWQTGSLEGLFFADVRLFQPYQDLLFSSQPDSSLRFSLTDYCSRAWSEPSAFTFSLSYLATRSKEVEVSNNWSYGTRSVSVEYQDWERVVIGITQDQRNGRYLLSYGSSSSEVHEAFLAGQRIDLEQTNRSLALQHFLFDHYLRHQRDIKATHLRNREAIKQSQKKRWWSF